MYINIIGYKLPSDIICQFIFYKGIDRSMLELIIISIITIHVIVQFKSNI